MHSNVRVLIHCSASLQMYSECEPGVDMTDVVQFKRSGADGEAHCALPHILLVVDQLSKTLGGGERVALRLAQLLPQYGFRVSILTFLADPACKALEAPPCSIFVLPLQRTYGLTAIRAALALRRFLHTGNIRLVQTFFESSDLWAGLVTKTMSDAKLIWSRRDMGILRGRKHEIAYRLLAGLPDAVFAVSDQVRQHCIAVDKISAGKVRTVYNGLDIAKWQSDSSRARSTDEPVITTIGNIRRVKGHDLFIRAASIVKDRFPHAKFCIAGAVLEPDYYAELKALVSSLALEERFAFLGPVDDVRGLLSCAEVFVLPSRSEGFSNSIVEAMASGLPVVATDVGGNSEAVENCVSGVIVPPEDVQALARALDDLLADPTRAREMGEAGKAIARRKFSIEAMMSETVSVYQQLLGEI